MPIPAAVLKLVENFEQRHDEYHAATYNETELRREFLDPFFVALGWDVANERGLSIARRDVAHEYSIKVEGEAEGEKKSRAPDYAFRIGEVDDKPAFFVEAKKPSVNVRDSAKFAFQIREYGWNAGLPFCVLSDFEEFAVYDCRFKPVVTEGSEKARELFFKHTEYAEKWDVLEGLFGRAAVKDGALQKRAQQEQKKGTVTVDAAFLSEIERWRAHLAADLVRRNKNLSAADLNYAVQMMIDRIIFLRMAEDRDLEPWGALQKLTQGHGAKNIYAALRERFKDADDRYNSGLFHFPNERRSGAKKRPGFVDRLTPTLMIGDDVLTTIIGGLYRPSPFNFRVMPIEILGQVYEQFLGKVIQLRSARTVEIADKPEVRKAGGVYYTPSYIVDAIVKQTVGALCEGKTPRQIETLRVLDPACGSGSFLIGAYGYLLVWHLDFYTKGDPKPHCKGPNAALFAVPDPIDTKAAPSYRLTTREKKRILLNNIYGVDIDRQAVEVTKLSLLLKVLEDESNEGLKLLNEPALPDLDDNIQCGNSLIGPDFYDVETGGIKRDTLTQAEQERINAFDWNTAFPSVLQGKNKGFDAVIGNPPYVDSEWMSEYAPQERAYCTSKYASASGNWDLFCVFVGKAVELCKPNGFSSLIVPNKLGSAGYAAGARHELANENRVVSIQDYSSVRVFPVAVYPLIYVAQKSKASPKSKVTYKRMAVIDKLIQCSQTHELNYADHFANPAQPWRIFGNLQSDNPAEKIRNKFPPLSSVAEVLGAATVGEAYELIPLIKDSTSLTKGGFRLVNSGTIDRYLLLWGQKPCRYLGASYMNPQGNRMRIY